jgi:hypothetical protein
MGKFRDLANKLKLVTIDSQEKDLLAIIRKHEAAAVDLNISQMLAGETSDGDKITPEYSMLTVEIKKSKGQPSDRVTLKDEGDFQQGMFMEAEKFPVTFNSKDRKAGPLSEKYDGIFGLTKPNLKDFASEIKPDVREYYGKLISLR